MKVGVFTHFDLRLDPSSPLLLLRAGPMKRILFALLALVLNLAAVSLAAQNPAGPPGGAPPGAKVPTAAGEVRGKIVAADSAGAAVQRPAVAVRNKSDGKLVTGVY